MDRFSAEGLTGRAGEIVRAFWHSEKGIALRDFLVERLKNGASVFPSDPYAALRVTPLEKARVIILGQDPYPTRGHAVGMAFSVAADVRPLPRSLKNIYKEIAQETGDEAPSDGDLISWARQGVLLLNTVLTVEEGQAGAHAKKGWEVLTDELIAAAAAMPYPKCFLLWGKWAQGKAGLIEESAKKSTAPFALFSSNHPSPLSASRGPVPFFGCGHFLGVNEFLLKNNGKTIHWFPEAHFSLES